MLSDFAQIVYVVLGDKISQGKEMRHSNWKESGETDFLYRKAREYSDIQLGKLFPARSTCKNSSVCVPQ